MRLVTRRDLDGLACAVILSHHEDIDDVLLIHPQDITDGNVEVTGGDILANVPYHPACAKWFDHHLLTSTNRQPPEEFDGAFGYAPSAAELVWKYYERDPRFEELVAETSRFDSARLTRQDVLEPQGYVLLGFTLDSRSGLGELTQYFLRCLDWLRTMPISDVLAQAQVQMRVALLREQDAVFRTALTEHSQVSTNVVFTDFRNCDPIPVGNRFLVYVLYPQCNVSLRAQWGARRESVVVSAGHSIVNRTCTTNIGVLMSGYGGGGHVGAGSAPLPAVDADRHIAAILHQLQTPAG